MTDVSSFSSYGLFTWGLWLDETDATPYDGHVQARVAERPPARKRPAAAGVYEIVPTRLMKTRKQPMIERMILHGFMRMPPRYVGCQIILVYEAFFRLIEKPYHGMSILSNDRLHHQNTRHKTKSPEAR
jgi:hypothetical protein